MPRVAHVQADLAPTIDAAWEDRANVTPSTTGAVREAVEEAMNLLDSGKARVAEKVGGEWQVHQWLKKAVLLSFRLNDMAIIKGGPGEADVVGQGALQVRRLGREPTSAQRASAPCRTASCGAAPISRPASS